MDRVRDGAMLLKLQRVPLDSNDRCLHLCCVTTARVDPPHARCRCERREESRSREGREERRPRYDAILQTVQTINVLQHCDDLRK